MVVGVAGSFAAVSTLLGSPIVGAFLLMEVAGLGGALLGVVLVPGLLAAGVGSLIFVGLDAWTGFGNFSLVGPEARPVATTDGGGVPLGDRASGSRPAILGAGIKRLALWLRPIVARNSIPFTALAGLAIGVIAYVFVESTNHSVSFLLFSGQDALPSAARGRGGLVARRARPARGLQGRSRTASRSAASAVVRSSRVCSSAPPAGWRSRTRSGLPMTAGAAMGMGAMTTAMLGLPLTAVMITTLFLGADGLTLMPVVIVAVAVSYVASARLAPPVAAGGTGPAPAAPGPDRPAEAGSAPNHPFGVMPGSCVRVREWEGDPPRRARRTF